MTYKHLQILSDTFHASRILINALQNVTKDKNYINDNGNRAVFLKLHATKKVKKTSSIMQHTFPNVYKDGFLTANNEVT